MPFVAYLSPERLTHLCRALLRPVGVISGLLLMSLSGWAEGLSVRVVDGKSGQGIAHATLVLGALGIVEGADAAGFIRITTVRDPGAAEGLVAATGYHSKRISLPPMATLAAPMLISLEPVVFQLEELVVVAEASEADRDRAREAASANPLGIVSAETLGERPEASLGEALETLAGVSVGNDEAGRAAIRIRGAAASQTRLTLDGQSMAGGGGRGSTRGGGSLNRIPREFLERIDVMKAPTPDMDMDAVGGTVDLRTSRVAGTRASRTSLSVGTTLDDFSGRLTHRFGLTHSTPVEWPGPARLGLLVALNANAGASRSEELRVLNQWPQRPSTDSGDPVPFLSRLRVGGRVSEREAKGFLVGADLELNPVTQIHFKWLMDRSSSLTDAHFHTYEFARGAILRLTEEAGAVERMRFEKQFLLQKVENRSMGLVLGATHRWDTWVVEESIGISRADRVIPGSTNTYFVTPRQYKGEYDLARSRPYPLVRFTDLMGASDPDVFGPAAYHLSRTIDTDFSEADEELALRVDVSRKWEREALTWTLKSGVKGRFREASQDQDKTHRLPLSEPFNLASEAVPGPSALMGGRYPAGPRLRLSDFVAQLALKESLLAEDRFSGELDSFASDFTVSEGIQAAYVMARLEGTLWSVIGGVRGEQSRMTTRGYETRIESLADGQRRTEVIPVSLKRSDGRLFPSLHGLMQMGDHVLLRASLSRTLQRPDFRDLSPSSRVNLDTRQIRSGNPDLRPFDAIAVDVGADLLLGAWGEASVGLFEKQIDDFIVDVEAGTVYLDDPGFTRNYPVNGSPARLRGIELGWRGSLGFVENWMPAAPALSVTYTYTDSTARYPGVDGVTVMLPEQLRSVLNAQATWRFDNWTLSLRTRYRGLRLDDLVRPGDDRYESPLWIHSLGVSVRMGPHWTAALNASNLSRNDQVAYQGDPRKILTVRPGTLMVSFSLSARFGGRPERMRPEIRADRS